MLVNMSSCFNLKILSIFFCHFFQTSNSVITTVEALSRFTAMQRKLGNNKQFEEFQQLSVELKIVKYF